MPTLDLQTGASNGSGPSPNPGSYSPQIQPRAQNLPANARAQRIISPFGEAAGDIEQGARTVENAVKEDELRQQQAQADMWLVQASSAAELEAQRQFQTATENGRPGSPITPDLEKSWKQHTDAQLEPEMGAGLKARYTEQLAKIREGLLSKSQEYDRQERVRNTNQNWQDGVENYAKTYSGISDPLAIDRKLQNDIGYLSSVNNTTPGTPEEKQKRKDYMLKILPDAAVSRWIEVDPESVASYSKGGFENAVNFVLRQEGGFNPHDGKRGATNYGINSQAHPDVDVTKLTPDGAKAIYKKDYWDAIGGDNLPPATALIAFDAAVNQGLPTAQKMLEESGGDPQKLLELRRERYEQTAKDPALAKYLPVWTKRLDDVAKAAGGFSSYRLGTFEQQRNWTEKAESKIRENRAEQSRILTQGTQLIKTVEDRLENGYVPPADEMAGINQYVTTSGNAELINKWMSVQDQSTAMQGYMKMTPAQLRNHVDTVLMPAVETGGATKQEFDRLQIAQKTLTAMDTQLQSDPLGWYQRAGGQVPPLDFTKPDGMQQRRAVARTVADSYAVPLEKAMFTPQESTQLVNSVKAQTPDKQVMAAMEFAKAFGPDTDNAAGIFHKDMPLFGYAASMIAADPSLVKTANDMLVGSKVLAEDKGAGIDKTKFDAEMANWDGYFTNPVQYAVIKQAAEAVYAARYYGKPFDAEGLSAAMEEVVGGRRGRVGGNPIIAPPMTDPDAFEAWTQTLTQDRLKEIMGGTLPNYKNVVFDPQKHPLKLRSIEPGAYYIEGGDGLPLAGNGPGGIAVLHITAADILKDAEAVKKAKAARRAADNSFYGAQ